MSTNTTTLVSPVKESNAVDPRYKLNDLSTMEWVAIVVSCCLEIFKAFAAMQALFSASRSALKGVADAQLAIETAHGRGKIAIRLIKAEPMLSARVVASRTR